uniref:Enoyl-CoA delta isomerase 1, mitochondrial n=1 Tax=Parastrongyloides trichosuri TaxID=131310 RepID=A0A0N5A6G7_PARTI
MFSIKKTISLITRLPVRISKASFSIPEYKYVEVKKEGPAFKIALNIPSTYNGLSFPLITEIADAVNQANECKDTKFTVVTGTGKFFSSGMDLRQFLELGTNGIIRDRHKIEEVFASFVTCFLYHDKLLIGAINGPAIGGAASMIAFLDYTVCSDDAYFVTPFTRFGFVPVDLMTVYFPRIMGKIRATEMMLLEKKLTATEALECGLVNEVVNKKDVWKATMEKVKKFDMYDAEHVKAVKKVIKFDDRKILEKKSRAEIKIFCDRICESKFVETVKDYYNKKN